MGCGKSLPRIKKLRNCVRLGSFQGKILQTQAQQKILNKSKSFSTNSSGSGGSSNTMISFDDDQAIKLRGQKFNKINAIKVSYTNNSILNMEISYELEDGSIITGESSKVYQCLKPSAQPKNEKNPNKNNQLSIQQVKLNHQIQDQQIQSGVFEILTDDYLLEISGSAHHSHVEQIKFKTYRGIEGTFGYKKTGYHFIFKEEGQTFGPLSGAFKQNNDIRTLAMFEFRLIDTPSDFLINLVQKKEIYSSISSPIQKQSHLRQDNYKSYYIEGLND